jgi:putative transposase
MSRGGTVDRERREFVVANLVDYRATHGALPARMAKATAQRLGVAPRTIYRWVAAGTSAHQLRAGYVPGEDVIALYFSCRGNVAEVQRRLEAMGGVVPGVHTLRRAFNDALVPAERAFAVNGVEGFRSHSVYLRIEQDHRNELWQMDHYEIPIWVSVPRRAHPEKAWLTALIDGRTRVVPGWAISLQPSTAEVLAAIRAGVLVDPELHPYGGVPEAILWDNGAEFLSDVVVNEILDLGCYCSPTAPYSPHQKGKIERFFNTVETEFARRMPFYTSGPRAANGHLYGGKEVDLMSLEELVVEFDTWIHHYNNERRHSAHGMTPRECWDSDPHPIRTIPASKVRHLLLARQTRTVRKDGIRWNGRAFFATELQGLVGEEIEVRYEPHNDTAIWLYRNGEFLAEAVPHEDLSEEVRRAHLGRRAEQQRRVQQKRKRGSRIQRVGRIKPITTPGPIEDTVEPTDYRQQTRRKRISEDDALALLGIEGVNEAVDPEAMS